MDFAHPGGAATLQPEDKALLGRPDVLILGVGGGAKVYDGVEAADVVKQLNPKVVIPVQYVRSEPPADRDQTGAKDFGRLCPACRPSRWSCVEADTPSGRYNPNRPDALTMRLLRRGRHGHDWYQRRAIGVCLALQGADLGLCGLIGTDARSAQPLLRAEGLQNRFICWFRCSPERRSGLACHQRTRMPSCRSAASQLAAPWLGHQEVVGAVMAHLVLVELVHVAMPWP